MDIQLREELNQSSYKYHLLIAKAGLILNPLFSIVDLFNIPEHFLDFLYFRLGATFLIFATILNRKKFQTKPEFIAVIAFLAISIQNAYMYSVMNVSEIQQHTFSYIALFIGAAMFFLWKIQFSILVVGISLLANIVFFAINGTLRFDQVLSNGGLLTLAVALFTILLIQTRQNLIIREIKSRLALGVINKKLEGKNEIIETQNADIISSINYAKRIQQAILPSKEKIDASLKNYFVFYEPKDIVSGDFYWFAKVNTTPKIESDAEEIIVISAVDCTGHGVPGALMSIIGNTILNQSLSIKDVNTPAQTLSYLNSEITKNLNSIKDGMDIALCAINLAKLELQYAGANNPLYLIRNNQLTIFKADKQAIGSDYDLMPEKTFTNHQIKLKEGDAIYIFTDGFADQFGGEESYAGGKKYKYNRFKELLIKINKFPMEKQKEMLLDEHLKWKGNLEQVDDILIIGIRV